MPKFQTTVRLDPVLKTSIDALRKVQKVTLNRLVNDALAFYVGHLLAEKSAALATSREALGRYGRRAQATAAATPLPAGAIARVDNAASDDASEAKEARVEMHSVMDAWVGRG